MAFGSKCSRNTFDVFDVCLCFAIACRLVRRSGFLALALAGDYVKVLPFREVFEGVLASIASYEFMAAELFI